MVPMHRVPGSRGDDPGTGADVGTGPDVHVAQTLLDAFDVSAALLDRDGRITVTNARWRAIMKAGGVTDADAGVGASYLDVCRKVRGTDERIAATVVEGLSGILEGREDAFSVTYRCDVGGGMRAFRMTAHGIPLIDAGAIVYHQDITQADATLAVVDEVHLQILATLDHLPMAVLLIGPDGTIQSASGSAVTAFLGGEDREHVVGRKASDVLPASVAGIRATGGEGPAACTECVIAARVWKVSTVGIRNLRSGGPGRLIIGIDTTARTAAITERARYARVMMAVAGLTTTWSGGPARSEEANRVLNDILANLGARHLTVLRHDGPASGPSSDRHGGHALRDASGNGWTVLAAGGGDGLEDPWVAHFLRGVTTSRITRWARGGTEVRPWEDPVTVRGGAGVAGEGSGGTVAVAPIRVAGQLWGIALAHHDDAAHRWSPDESGILAIIGDLVAGASVRQDALEALEFSEAKYRRLFDNANDATFVMDMDGVIQDANDAALRLANVPREFLGHVPMAEMLPPEDQARVWSIAADQLAGVPTPQPFLVHMNVIGGPPRAMEFSTQILVHDDHPRGFQGIGRDVTAREHHASLRDLLLDISRTLLSGHDTQTLENAVARVREFFRAEACTLHGPRADRRFLELLGMACRDDATEVARESAAVESVRTMSRHGGHPIAQASRVEGILVARVTPPGGDQSNELVAAPLPTDDGATGVLTLWNPDHAVDDAEMRASLELVAHEIGRGIARHRLVRRLEATNQRLDAKVKDLDQFAFSVSHDLRAPIRGLEARARMVLEDHGASIGSEGREAVTKIADLAVRAQAMIEKLLRLSQLERGTLAIGPVDTAQAFAAARTSLEHLLAESDARLVVTTALPTVLGDPNLIEEVFANLLTNAIKFTRPGEPPSIEVSAREQGDAWELRVRDHGPGIPDAYRDDIFEMYRRGPKGVSDRVPGFGAGLAITERILRELGGTIGVENARDGGAVFAFTLPKVG